MYGLAETGLLEETVWHPALMRLSHSPASRLPQEIVIRYRARLPAGSVRRHVIPYVAGGGGYRGQARALTSNAPRPVL